MLRTRPLARLIPLAFASTLSLSAQAASHREAPLIAQDPVADITDVYAFVSYDEENLKRDPADRRVTLIMNVLPGQNPADGPNYFSFGDNVVYRLNVDNNQDGKAEDIVYEFRFKTENRPNPTLGDTPLAFVAVPPITALDGAGSEGITRRQTYTVTEIRGHRRTRLFDGQTLVAVPSNVGARTTPNYDQLAAQGIYTGTCANGTPGVRAFAGQRAETFYIDLGATFDTLNLRRNLPLLSEAEDASDSANAFGINRFANTNVNTIALEVPIKCLTKNGKPVAKDKPDNALIGLYASTSRTKIQVLRRSGDPADVGPFVQVARMGNPLVNELIINTSSKDRWNADEPENEARFQGFYKNPVIATALNAVFGVPIVPLDNSQPNNRTDLMGILLKYPGQGLNGDNCGSPCSELLRLDLRVPPTAPEAQKRLGAALSTDNAGWPNGRRPNDDVTDIAVRVVGGTNYINARAGDGVNFLDGAPGLVGVDVTANGIARKFPFLPTPYSGRE